MHPAFTLVLTAAPGSGVVTEAVARTALGTLNAAEARGRWLSPGDAWETGLDISPPHTLAELRSAVERAISPAPIDVNILPTEPPIRRKRLLCADMESTIIEQELVDELAGLVGCHAEISAITAAAMRGELDFEASLVRRVALFAGLEADRLETLLDRATFMPGAIALVRTMRANGARTALISGGFTIFAERIAQRAGFDVVVANTLEIENGRLTGRVLEPILGPQGKADALKCLAAESGLTLSDTLAVGDGANDVSMLAVAGLGVAFRAKPILAQQARASQKDAVVTHGDLTALLSLQNYRSDAFTSGTPKAM